MIVFEPKYFRRTKKTSLLEEYFFLINLLERLINESKLFLLRIFSQLVSKVSPFFEIPAPYADKQTMDEI